MSVRRTFRRVFGVIALLLVLSSVSHVLSTGLLLLRAERVTGTVVDHHVVDGASPPFMQDQGRLYYAVVEYRDSGGRSQRVVASQGRRSRTPQPGSELGVWRVTGDGSGSRIDSRMELWGGALIFGGLAVVFALIGLMAPAGFRRSTQAPGRSL